MNRERDQVFQVLQVFVFPFAQVMRFIIPKPYSPRGDLFDSVARYKIGDTLRQQNDSVKAIGMLERSVEADKGHTRAVELLARMKSGG